MPRDKFLKLVERDFQIKIYDSNNIYNMDYFIYLFEITKMHCTKYQRCNIFQSKTKSTNQIIQP